MTKILLVEDEMALQKTLSDYLKTTGYEVINAFDGQKGLELAEKEIPNLILLDLILPKMDGFEVLNKLKENPNTENIPIIVLTNLEDLPSIEKVLKKNIKAYLVKADYSLEEVVEKIKEALKT